MWILVHQCRLPLSLFTKVLCDLLLTLRDHFNAVAKVLTCCSKITWLHWMYQERLCAIKRAFIIRCFNTAVKIERRTYLCQKAFEKQWRADKSAPASGWDSLFITIIGPNRGRDSCVNHHIQPRQRPRFMHIMPLLMMCWSCARLFLRVRKGTLGLTRCFFQLLSTLL